MKEQHVFGLSCISLLTAIGSVGLFVGVVRHGESFSALHVRVAYLTLVAISWPFLCAACVLGLMLYCSYKGNDVDSFVYATENAWAIGVAVHASLAAVGFALFIAGQAIWTYVIGRSRIVWMLVAGVLGLVLLCGLFVVTIVVAICALRLLVTGDGDVVVEFDNQGCQRDQSPPSSGDRVFEVTSPTWTEEPRGPLQY